MTLKGKMNPATAELMKEVNNLAAGKGKNGKRVRGWTNLCSTTVWGSLADAVRTSGIGNPTAYEIHFLSTEGRLDLLRSSAAQLSDRYYHEYGIYLTAQVALDIMTLRVLDETWDGASGEIESKTLIENPSELHTLTEWAGQGRLVVRFATAFEDGKFAIDIVVLNAFGQPVLAFQVKKCRYFYPTGANPKETQANLNADKVKNIKANNAWLEQNPTAITVIYLDTDDVKAGVLRSIRDDMPLSALAGYRDLADKPFVRGKNAEVAPPNGPRLIKRSTSEAFAASELNPF